MGRSNTSVKQSIHLERGRKHALHTNLVNTHLRYLGKTTYSPREGTETFVVLNFISIFISTEQPIHLARGRKRRLHLELKDGLCACIATYLPQEGTETNFLHLKGEIE